MEKNKRILEALQMQPLSEEEKQARHILGRLWGPIATCKESTRNGRLYNKPLWERALVDEIFLEKVATKSLFLELGHPADREETDMTKACACIPEVPKIVDGDLYTYVDIIDTPNGRLLKTLIDYGFVPGISSRGSGDVMSNNEVDPETFFLETWDIVQLPAVKKARLNICESLESGNQTQNLKKALTESYNSASEEEKSSMKEALDNLNISLNEETEVLPGGTPSNVEDIPFAEEEQEELLQESEEFEDDEFEEDEIVEQPEEAINDEESEQEIENEAEEDAEEIIEEAATVGDLKDFLEKIDSETKLEFKNVEIEGREYQVVFELDDSLVEDGKLEIGVICEPVEGNSEHIEEPVESSEIENEPVEGEDEISDEENPADEIENVESENEPEEAEDNGDEEVIESLKEAIRQKDALEREIKALKKEKSVGDAKEKQLEEELNKYKAAFARVSGIAKKTTSLEKEVSKLNEQLTQKENQINGLQNEIKQTKVLNESINKDASRIKTLTEKLDAMQKESEENENALKEQISQCNQKIKERTTLAKSYKAKFLEAMTNYVNSKASMLGVRPSEITSRLNENFNTADVDAVCDELLETNLNFSRLPFNSMSRTSAKMRESVNKKVTEPEYGYDIDDSLLELAGLKK